MKIKYKARAAGPDGIRNIGDIADLPEAQAKRLVAGGYADALEPFSEPAKEQTKQQTAPKRKAAGK